MSKKFILWLCSSTELNLLGALANVFFQESKKKVEMCKILGRAKSENEMSVLNRATFKAPCVRNSYSQLRLLENMFEKKKKENKHSLPLTSSGFVEMGYCVAEAEAEIQMKLEFLLSCLHCLTFWAAVLTVF